MTNYDFSSSTILFGLLPLVKPSAAGVWPSMLIRTCEAVVAPPGRVKLTVAACARVDAIATPLL